MKTLKEGEGSRWRRNSDGVGVQKKKKRKMNGAWRVGEQIESERGGCVEEEAEEGRFIQ